MKRENWEEYLALYLEKMSEKIFVWGESDCVLFAAGALDACTGSNYYETHKGKYSDTISAAQYLRDAGFATVRGTAISVLGDSIPPTMAQRGDIVSMQNRLGVCVGEYSWFMGSVGEHGGMLPEPTFNADKAWRV
jgi:hypothetical protein